MKESMYPFENKTTYDRPALEAMNRLAEATVRKKKSTRTRSLCFIIGVFLLAAGAYYYNVSNMIGSLMLIYGVLLLLGGLYWKKIQVWGSQRQLNQQRSRECTYVFDEEQFACVTENMTDAFRYEQVSTIVCDKDWYVLFFDEGHGVIIDRKGFTVGDDMSFRGFIGMHTQLPILDI